MRIRAEVKRVTGATRHYEGRIEGGVVRVTKRFPAPSFVEIMEAEGKGEGFFLLYFDSEGRCITDTWHRTVEDAQAQAKDEFDINEKDWIEVQDTP